jgi:hypothetical protein
MVIMDIKNYTLVANQDSLAQGQFGRVFTVQNTQKHR